LMDKVFKFLGGTLGTPVVSPDAGARPSENHEAGPSGPSHHLGQVHSHREHQNRAPVQHRAPAQQVSYGQQLAQGGAGRQSVMDIMEAGPSVPSADPIHDLFGRYAGEEDEDDEGSVPNPAHAELEDFLSTPDKNKNGDGPGFLQSVTDAFQESVDAFAQATKRKRRIKSAWKPRELTKEQEAGLQSAFTLFDDAGIGRLDESQLREVLRSADACVGGDEAALRFAGYEAVGDPFRGLGPLRAGETAPRRHTARVPASVPYFKQRDGGTPKSRARKGVGGAAGKVLSEFLG